MREGEEKQGDARRSQGMPGNHSKESVKKTKEQKKQKAMHDEGAKGKARESKVKPEVASLPSQMPCEAR